MQTRANQSILARGPIDLGDGLQMRLARADEAEALVDFNTRVFDERVTDWTRDLCSGQHPTVSASDFTIVEEVSSKRIVSSLGLISQTWACGGVRFGVGRPDLVATDPEYRRRGLVRKQFDLIHALSESKGELMQVITGVDWFYRQFGYEMGVGLWGSRCVESADITPLRERAGLFRLRPAIPADSSFIRKTYDQVIASQTYAAVRSPKEWEYEFSGRLPSNTRRREFLILENMSGEQVGYVQYLPCLPSKHSHLFRIYQIELKPGVSYLNAFPDLLCGLWAKGQELQTAGVLPTDDLRGLELALERDHPMFRVLPKEVFRDPRTPPWYIRIPDLSAFLRRLRPALEQRLFGSPAEGYNGELRLSFFRAGLRLAFEKGSIQSIEPWLPGEVYEGDARFPGLTFLQLVCGWRRCEQIMEAFPECTATPEARLLLNLLFPSYSGKVWVLA